MCCFSGPVRKVESTKIFARRTGADRQLLVYELKLAADAEVAMILPLPTPAGTAEDAVRFVSLERYPELFTDLQRAFPVPASAPAVRSNRHLLFGAPPLVVHSVGAFVASFVPSLADFTRLDPRFRIPAGTIDRVPEYADWGFAVFQLKPPSGSLARIHPMAFEMPTRRPAQLFFPTVHVHDGELHAEADFAHQLYAQHAAPAPDWWPAGTPLHHVVDGSRAEGLVDLDATVSMRSLFGRHPNRDVWIDVT